jgi:hypothetical protein
MNKDHFERFEAVRSSGNWNMYDIKARKATGLTKDEYYSVMRNYTKLMELYPDVRK